MKNTSYKIAKRDTGKFAVIRIETDSVDRYYALPRNMKETVLADGLEQFTAEYIKSVFDFLYRKDKSVPSTYDEAASRFPKTDAKTLAFWYVKESLGEGWSMQNAYKLLNDFLIDMWFSGSMRHGCIPLEDLDKTKIYDELKSAVSACMKMYGGPGIGEWRNG